ncbi:hypothetical protein O181_005127 [Austropuccinia psidii MF-1]|uniref:Uncharacterized protein n=1 Tax=Austropuccinia psidii MF-1 TaxID=1389203 RepID=A0A9Q3BHJ7_9BASI|nr:hypothetical protein [Austropuccinia psidii MF-1]
MEEILHLTQLTYLKILLVESYQQKYNHYRKISRGDLNLPSTDLGGMQIKVEQVHLFPILVTWPGFLPRILSELDPPKNCLKMVGTFSNLKESHNFFPPSQDPISMEVHPPSVAYFSLRTSKDIKDPKLVSRASSSHYHQRRRGIGSLSNTGLKA